MKTLTVTIPNCDEPTAFDQLSNYLPTDVEVSITTVSSGGDTVFNLAFDENDVDIQELYRNLQTGNFIISAE
jgi:hypothetical protein